VFLLVQIHSLSLYNLRDIRRMSGRARILVDGRDLARYVDTIKVLFHGVFLSQCSLAFIIC